MSTPFTSIIVCSGVRINNSYTHTLYFENPNKQFEYFTSKRVKVFGHHVYCRRAWDIKLESKMEDALKWDYLYFLNPQDNKHYFYFITSVEYISDTTVKVHLEMDVLQTYLFDWDLRPCFVERMTPVTDEVGENTVDEGLEVGELTIINKTDVNALQRGYCLMLMATEPLIYYTDSLFKEIFFQPKLGLTDGIFSGLSIYCCDLTEDGAYERLGNFFEKITNNSETVKNMEGIVSMWLYPRDMVVSSKYADSEDKKWDKTFSFVEASNHINVTFNKFDYVDGGYAPKNKKLLSYPYTVLHVTNNNGGSADFRLERFSTPNANFEIIGSVYPDGGVKLVPKNYNGTGYNDEAGITLTGFPTCAWDSDTYKIWLAQNQNQHAVAQKSATLSGALGVGAMVAGAVTANPMMIAGGFASTVSGITQTAQLLARIEDMKTTPDQAHGAQSASINACNNKCTFTGYVKTVTTERAKIIDDYFTMYGYKHCRVMKPTIHNRSRFTFIKTVDCHVDGQFCNEDKLKIQAIFNNGVTFWADTEGMGNYSISNDFLEN